MLDGQLTGGTGHAVSLGKINMTAESSSLKIVTTLLTFFSLICFPATVTQHIPAGAKGIISKRRAFGHTQTGSAEYKVYSIT